MDEFNDRPDDLKALVKKWSTNSNGVLTLKVVDEKRKFLELRVKGAPVIWTNSMELVEDVGNQVHNRFFKLNVDESLVQSQTCREVSDPRGDVRLGRGRQRPLPRERRP